jgi:hypothetical protein
MLMYADVDARAGPRDGEEGRENALGTLSIRKAAFVVRTGSTISPEVSNFADRRVDPKFCTRAKCMTMASAAATKSEILMSNDLNGPDRNEPVPGTAPNPAFMKEFEQTIQSYAKAVSDDRPEDAQNAALQALLMAGEEALRNPTPSLRLKEEVGQCEERGDWADAETACRKVLALEESSGKWGMIAKAEMDLYRLLRLLGRLNEAWEFACRATTSARRTEIFPVLVMALECQVRCALDRGDTAGALTAASEAVQIIEPGELYDQMRARALAARARCSLASGELAAAESDLASSWALLQTRSGTAVLPGPILTLANWWEVKSELEEQRGSPESAREAMTKAIEYLRQLHGPYALFAVARALTRLSTLLNQAGDSFEAERAADEATAIRRDLRLVSGPGD